MYVSQFGMSTHCWTYPGMHAVHTLFDVYENKWNGRKVHHQHGCSTTTAAVAFESMAISDKQCYSMLEHFTVVLCVT